MRVIVSNAVLVGLITATGASEAAAQRVEVMPLPLQASQAVAISPRAPEARLTGFSVSLVEGDLAGGPPVEGLPIAAAKAIADLKDFLPYKSFRVVDTTWILNGGGGRSASGRLRSATGQEYTCQILANMIT